MAIAGQADRAENGQWTAAAVRSVDDLVGYRPSKTELDKFGGFAVGPRLKATGFFRTEHLQNRWVLVDPEGCPFISVGLCSVNLAKFPVHAATGKFGSQRAWAEQTATMLREIGFNTLGRWSDVEAFRELDVPFAYCTTLSFMKSYAKRRPKANGAPDFPERTMPVFDKEFESYCDIVARQLSSRKDDPWLLGHFSDNELPIRPDALTCYLKLPPSDPGHREAERWIAARHKAASAANDHDQLEFAAVVAERYFTTVSRAIKKYDPNHLYLGSRLNGKNINDGALRGSHSVDVVSINMYHYWTVDHEHMDRWAALANRPILNSEWYAMSLATADTEVRGAGFRVRNDRDRGLFYQNLCLGMLSNPNCVGWHWFRYGGDGETDKRAFVDAGFVPHQPMTEQMKQLNTQTYSLRNFLLDQPKTPATKDPGSHVR
jgi:hypothetical protein